MTSIVIYIRNLEDLGSARTWRGSEPATRSTSANLRERLEKCIIGKHFAGLKGKNLIRNVEPEGQKSHRIRFSSARKTRVK